MVTWIFAYKHIVFCIVRLIRARNWEPISFALSTRRQVKVAYGDQDPQESIPLNNKLVWL